MTERLKAEMDAAVHAAGAAYARARYLDATAAIDEREATVRAAWDARARFHAALAAQNTGNPQ